MNALSKFFTLNCGAIVSATFPQFPFRFIDIVFSTPLARDNVQEVPSVTGKMVPKFEWFV